MNYNILISKKNWIFLIVFISILSIIIKSTLFTDNFFYTGILLLDWLKLGAPAYATIPNGHYDGLYLFYYIDFFNIDSLLGWNIYISIIFFFINLKILGDIHKISLNKFVLILISLILWYLFSAGLTKEVIQTLFYIIIYYVINDKIFIKTKKMKVLIGSIILFISSIIFRPYYILIAIFSIIIYAVNSYLKEKRITSFLYYFYSLILYLVIIGMFLKIISIIMPIEYSTITELRTSVGRLLLGERVDSFIDNIFIGDGLLIYMLNYITIYFRLLFPLELLTGKSYYLLFIMYQLCFSYYYIKSIFQINKLNDIKYISVIFITSFILVSVMFEPDFGSWVRHQSVCYVLLINLLKET